MTYDVRYRSAVLSFLEEGGSKVEAAKLFKVSRDTIYRWLALDDLAPKKRPRFHHRKIDKEKLCRHVEAYPEMFLRERAQIFGVHVSSMSRALAKLGFRKKKSGDI